MKKIILAILLLLIPESGHSLVLEKLIADKILPQTLQDKKLGYYVGSFDPIHIGHDTFLRTVLDNGDCDLVLIYPAWGSDKYKKRTDVSIRSEMLFALYAEDSRVIVTKMSPKELQDVFMDFDTVTGIIGSDTAINSSVRGWSNVLMSGRIIPAKHETDSYGSISALEADSFIVGIRNGDNLDVLKGSISGRPIRKVIELKSTEEISSTAIRKKFEAGDDLKNIVDSRVKEIINNHGLYAKP